jgi:hypothetical protein
MGGSKRGNKTEFFQGRRTEDPLIESVTVRVGSMKEHLANNTG